MVSLRARKSQPSYTSLAGLENISDEEERDDQNAGPSNLSKGGGEDEGDQSDVSMSSGASSAFQPVQEEEGKQKGLKRKRKGKGKAKADLRDGSESPFEAGSANGDTSDDAELQSVKTDDEPMDTDLESIGEVTASKKGKGTTKGARIKSGLKEGVIPAYGLVRPTKSTTMSSGQTKDNSSLHPTLKELVKQSSETIAKGQKASVLTTTVRDHEKYKTTGLNGMSSGPITPFTTVLADDPKKTAEMKTTWEPVDIAARRLKRQTENWEVNPRIPLYSPWSVWQGEGWWPEMYHPSRSQSSAHTKKGKGKDKGSLGNPDWKLREEVDLGLGLVGRYRPQDIQRLTFDQAADHLPTNKSVVCHMGPHDSQRPMSFAPLTASAVGLQQKDKHTQMFCAGGPIWGMDWCPTTSNTSIHHLAVSTVKDLEDRPAIGVRRPRSDKAAIQIWSLDTDRSSGEPGNRMRCELILCIQGGAALDLKWMPMGARDEIAEGESLPKLGILAAVQLDGSISFYSVPYPQSVRATYGIPTTDSAPVLFRIDEPLLRLVEEEAVFTCFDWMTGSRIVAGLSNGHGIVYDLLNLLKGKMEITDLLPIVCATVSDAPIRAVAAARYPRCDSAGLPIWNSDPAYAIFTGYDCVSYLLDIRDPEGIAQINKERKPSMDVAWAYQVAGPVIPDGDNAVQMYKPFGGGKHRINGFVVHNGGIWSVSTSDYHTMLASGSADGSVKIGSSLNGLHRKRHHNIIDHRLFEMDYDEHTKEYRMVEDFVPEVLLLSQSSDRFLPKNQKLAPQDPRYVSTSAWSTHVAVHKVKWNNNAGLRGAGWLAAGMACGLGRVEWIEGRFAR